jgi:hypothetical protein
MVDSADSKKEKKTIIVVLELKLNFIWLKFLILFLFGFPMVFGCIEILVCRILQTQN